MSYFSNTNTIANSSSNITLSSGNYILDVWRKIIQTPSGRSNVTAIDLLSYIYYLHKPSKFGQEKKFKDDLLRLRYEDLEEKFHKSRETIRKAFITLEKLNLIKRIVRNYKGNYHNGSGIYCAKVLYIEFNKKEYYRLYENYISNSSQNNLDIELYNTKNQEQKLKTSTSIIDTPKNWGISPQKLGDIYREKEKRNKEANSYELSSFIFGFKVGENIQTSQTTHKNLNYNILNIDVDQPISLSQELKEIPNKTENLHKSYSTDFKQNAEQNRISEHQTSKIININQVESTLSPVSMNSWNFEDYKLRPASEFLPIDPEFCNLIRLETGRDFPDSYFEDVVVKFISDDESKKDNKQAILKWSKRHLFARLVAWTMRELKDTSQLLFEFGIKSHTELEESRNLEKLSKKEVLEEEKMISRYESSRDTSSTGILKRKIAGFLPREEAVLFLTNTSFSIDHESKQVIAKIMYWNKKTEKLLCTQDDIDQSKKLLLEQSLKNISESLLGQGAEALILCDFAKNKEETRYEENNKIITYSDNELYRKIQESLFNKFGEGVYKSWFSKLEFHRVKDSKKTIKSLHDDNVLMIEEKNLIESESQRICGESIYVTSPNTFISDWITRNYLNAIEESFKEVSIDMFDIYSITSEEFKAKLFGIESTDCKTFELVDSSRILENQIFEPEDNHLNLQNISL